MELPNGRYGGLHYFTSLRIATKSCLAEMVPVPNGVKLSCSQFSTIVVHGLNILFTTDSFHKAFLFSLPSFVYPFPAPTHLKIRAIMIRKISIST